MEQENDTQHDQLPSVEEVKTNILASKSTSPLKMFRKPIFLKMVTTTLILATIISLSVAILVVQKDCRSEAKLVDASEMEGLIRNAVVQKGIVSGTGSTNYLFSDRSIQQRALSKIMKESTLTEEMAIQRYALWTFFYATEHVGTPVTSRIYGIGTVPTWKDSWTNDGPDPCLWYGVRCNSFGTVVELNLSDSRITGMLPPELKLLDSLTTLDLSENIGLGHGGVPIWLKEMDSLQFIDLRGCSFTDNAPLEVCESTKSFYAECPICSCCNLCNNV